MKGWRLLLLLLLLLWAEGVFCDPKVVDYCQKDLIIGFEGKSIVLQPVVHGIPRDITWKKEGNIVHIWDGKDHSNGSLIIGSISRSDAGIYKAEALVGSELQDIHYCLKVLDSLRPPDLICSVHNDSIQVNCTAPPQITSQNLPVSYLWKDRGRSIHNKSSLQFERNTDHPEEITCIVYIANVNASNSINLSGCIPEAQQADARTRTRTALIVLLVILLIALGIGLLWKKGCFRKCQEHPDAPRNQETSPEELSLSGSKSLSDSAQNLEENEGSAEHGPLKETQPHNHSRCLSENMEEEKREDAPRNQEPSLEEELPLNGIKPA